MKSLTISEPAQAEFREITKWYRERDVRVAERFADEARRTLDLIERHPQIGSHVPNVADPTVRRMPIHNFPYHIVFVDLGDRLEVAAFAHYRRGPEYLKNRLGNL